MRAAMIILAFCLSACTVTVHRAPEQPLVVSEGDHGPYPENHEDIVRTYFEHKLKDPFSAQYELHEPIKAYLRKAPISGGAPYIWGYIVYVRVNAKNSYGGYVGWREHRLFIRNGRIHGEVLKNPWFKEPWYS